MEEDIRFHKGFTPVDPRGAASWTNSNWKLELCSLRGIYVQASGGGLIKLPRQWFRPDLISSWLVLLLPSSWTLSLSLSPLRSNNTGRLSGFHFASTPLPLLLSLSLNWRHRVNIGVREIQSKDREFSFNRIVRIPFFDLCLLPDFPDPTF